MDMYGLSMWARLDSFGKKFFRLLYMRCTYDAGMKSFCRGEMAGLALCFIWKKFDKKRAAGFRTAVSHGIIRGDNRA